jgi:hypothetical protein
MKLPVVLLGLSVAANAVLVGAILRRPGAAGAFFREVFSTGEQKPPAAPGAGDPAAARKLAKSPAASADGGAAIPVTWPELESGDLATLARRLRAAGFPPSVIQAFVHGVADRRFSAVRRQLMGQRSPEEYWRTGNVRPDAETMAELRKLEREHRKTIRDALGPDFYPTDDPGYMEQQRRQFGQLPEEKITALRKIFSDYEDLTEQAFADGPNRGTPEGRAKFALLEKEKRADIERLLTPGELLDYDLRNSNAAHGLRNRFGQFQPTEAEFRALYPAQKALADFESSFQRPQTLDMRKQREAIEQQVQAELRQVLGDARYAEFTRANDQSLQQTQAFVERQNLPPAAVDRLIAVKNDLQPRIAAVQSNRDLTINQREAQLAALHKEATEKITAVIGPQNVEAYSRQGGGWITQLARREDVSPGFFPGSR